MPNPTIFEHHMMTQWQLLISAHPLLRPSQGPANMSAADRPALSAAVIKVITTRRLAHEGPKKSLVFC